MTAVVTGASGHLGQNIVRALVARGEPVRALVRKTTRGLEDLPVELVEGDVCDGASLDGAFRDAAVVYHSAAVIALGGRRALAERVNIEGTREVLAAAGRGGVGRVVHVSSAFVLDPEPRSVPVDEARAYVTPRPYAIYEATKIAAEGLVADAVQRGLDAVIVNPTSLIGPRDPEPSRVGRLLIDLYNRTLPALVRGGFDWVDVRDAAAGTLAAADRGRPGERYILGGRWHSLRALADVAAEVTGRRPPRLELPVGVARLGIPFSYLRSAVARTAPRVTRSALDALDSNRAISSDKARRELGHASRPVRASIEDFYRHAAARGLIDWQPPSRDDTEAPS